MLQHDAIVSVKSDVLFSDLGKEVVMLNAETGTYYGLEGVGVTIWNLIQQAKPARIIHATVVSEYCVDPTECWNDLTDFLGDLEKKGLIEITS